jgi:hypothetical protein
MVAPCTSGSGRVPTYQLAGCWALLGAGSTLDALLLQGWSLLAVLVCHRLAGVSLVTSDLRHTFEAPLWLRADPAEPDVQYRK